MNQTQTITFALLFSVLFFFAVVQHSLNSSHSPVSDPFSGFFDQKPPLNFEAAELERQSGLSCAQ
jgi:hypothetical protein